MDIKIQYYISIICFILLYSCAMKVNSVDMKNNKNPLFCDSDTGICELPSSNENILKVETIPANVNRVKIIYFTDPICSSCWSVEPQLRKLKLEYGNNIEIEYHMGGLLADWSYNSGGISSPTDVATHWDEASTHYDMPIVGDVWLEDPLHSSYPPSIAFKAAQLQDEQKAIQFLRKIREYVFLEKKNIAKWKHIKTAAKLVGLDVTLLERDYKGKAIDLFNEDLMLAKRMRVRGFPSFFFSNSLNQQEFIYGSRPYSEFENKLLKLQPEAKKVKYDKSSTFLFDTFSTLTAREFSDLSEKERENTEKYLETLCDNKILKKLTTKNGNLYFKNRR